MKQHLLIDADLLLYKASIGAEFACDWGGGNWVLSANLQQAKDAIEARVNGMMEHFETDRITMVRSGHGNFRTAINPDYKSSRKTSRKPIIFNELKDWMDEVFKCQWLDDCEADDTLGILHTAPDAGDTIIISEDKDMLTVPGRLYRGGELLTITPLEARYRHLYQTLTGDATDGYPGCPGVGPKTAEKLLAGSEDTWWPNVLQAYHKAGLTEDDAILNARMAYILHYDDWKDGGVRIWQPSQTLVTT
jgi:DNA polymerase I